VQGERLLANGLFSAFLVWPWALNNQKTETAAAHAELEADTINKITAHIDNVLTYTDFSKTTWDKIREAVHLSDKRFVKELSYILNEKLNDQYELLNNIVAVEVNQLMAEIHKGDSLTLKEQHQIRTSHDRIINQINDHIEKVVAAEKERQNLFWMNQFKATNAGL
jgi:hypothetical protein